MTQPGYQEGSEPAWWWKVAKHLDEAQLASTNAMAHNLDDQTPVHAFQDKLREAQAILWKIFHWKGLLPVDLLPVVGMAEASNGTAVQPDAQPDVSPSDAPLDAQPSVVEDPPPPPAAVAEVPLTVTVDAAIETPVQQGTIE